MGGTMGKKVADAESEEITSQDLSINLFGPGMTLLHKVGLAGLWMTLKALEGDEEAMNRLREAGGSWERTGRSVVLHWNKDPDLFFNALFAESFKIDKSGLLWFPALGRPIDHAQHSVVLQEAVLGSFLQHGRTRKSDKAQEPGGAASVEIDDKPLVLRFHRITNYAHQRAGFSATDVNPLAGWHFPGGAVRHVGLGPDSTALEEPPDRALALRFAPVGAIYFEIHRPGVRRRYALVLPEIVDLEAYARARACFLRYGVQQLYLAGAAEAGLRVLAELQASGLLQDISSAHCRVISFGTVPWSPQQKTRVEIFTVQAGSEDVLRTFAVCQHFFQARLVKPAAGDPFWDVPQVPDFVAQNLSEGRRWWEGFEAFLSDQDQRDHVLGYSRDKRTGKIARIYSGEKGGLSIMVRDQSVFPDGPEHKFVLACQEALRRHMGRKFARPGGADWGTEFEKVRVSIARCKNLASFRETITDFWARGGTLHKGDDTLLTAGPSWWKEVMPLLEEKSWRKAKDLALLALASYPGGSEEPNIKQS